MKGSTYAQSSIIDTHYQKAKEGFQISPDVYPGRIPFLQPANARDRVVDFFIWLLFTCLVEWSSDCCGLNTLTNLQVPIVHRRRHDDLGNSSLGSEPREGPTDASLRQRRR